LELFLAVFSPGCWARVKVAATSLPQAQTEAVPMGRVTLAPQVQVMVSTGTDFIIYLRPSQEGMATKREGGCRPVRLECRLEVYLTSSR